MASPVKDKSSTPMLRQYRSIKAKNPDCILFFRLGDFYEMFYDDAKIAAKVLDLVLTARGKGTDNKVPMCGFPHHSSENYIARLIKAGHKVAICEQVEDPAEAKGIVKRDITRIISSGTYLDESSSEARYILSLSPNAKHIGLSFTDPVDGAIRTNQYPLGSSRVVELIASLPVKECVFPETDEDRINGIFDHPLLKTKRITLSPVPEWSFNPEMARKLLCDHFSTLNLNGFGIEDYDWAISSSGALLEYLKTMNKQPLEHIDRLSLYTDDDYVFIAPAAYHGLELQTLIDTLDKTATALGKRKLAYWITHPLKHPAKITERQDAAKVFLENTDTLRETAELLKQIPDVEKNISRISCGYTHAKDLLAIRNTLALIPELKNILDGMDSAYFQIDDIPELREELINAIDESVPLSKPDGKVIRNGHNAELDELKDMLSNGHSWLKRFQEREAERTGISSLKVGFNKVFGYYIEISKANISKAPEDYIRKQTLVNAERFITEELKEYEEKILSAEDKILKLEAEIIKELVRKVLANSVDLHNFCETVAEIDTLHAIAKLAQNAKYIAPEITQAPILDITDGRHPVVEAMIDDEFIANDTQLDCEGEHLVILTGPNMAGKSTYIRQTAVLTIMAQAGWHIPAAKARIGIVDKIFTRIGAHDDIAKGQSTFMVEMSETADILNNLTDRSLVILDEIGRGTSTYDGLSLAWALAEHLAGSKARTLFATHFHELTALADRFEGVANYNVAVKEWKDKIIFMHKIVPGSTDDSYGIYVAKLAGIPQNVISRSKQILTQLETKADIKANLTGSHPEQQLSLFNRAADPEAEALKEELSAIDINTMTPIESLNTLKRLKDIADGQS